MRNLARLALALPLVSLGCGSPETEPTPAAPSVPFEKDSPWPKFRANAAQDARSSVKPKATGGASWEFPTGKGIFSSPVVSADGTIYVGSADRFFYALNPDGTLRFKVETGEIIDSAALLDDKGRVYFGSGDGHLRALDAKTGDVVWTFDADDPSVNTAYINWFEGNVAMGPDGTLYVPNDNYFVYAIDRDTGAAKWKFRMSDQTWSSPAVDVETGTLYIGNNQLLPLLGKNTFAIDKDGNNLWDASTPGTIAASPLLTADGTVVLGGFDGFNHAYTASDGTALWDTPALDHVYSSPALLPDGTVVVPAADGTVYALDPKTGEVKWTFDTPEPIRSSPAVDGDGNVYFGGGDGTLYVLNEDGTLRFSIQLIDEPRRNLNASPALGKDAVYIAGENGKIFSVPYDHCLRPEQSGDARCSTTPPESGPESGASLVYTKPFGGLAFTPPAEIDANQALAFTLRVRDGGRTRLAILDSASLQVEVTPPTNVKVDLSGDGKFVAITPEGPFQGDASGNLEVHVTGDYLVDLEREGLKVSGGKVGGQVTGDFTFALTKPDAFALPLPIPQSPGDPAGVMEIHRMSLPYPTILPSYNQIGFDSLHYLIGFVEGTSDKAVAWMAGGRLLPGKDETAIDPATMTLLPLVLTYDGGLLTLANNSGLTVNVLNVDLPLDTFRVASRLAADGSAPSGASLSGSTVCGKIPTYGAFLQKLGFCNPQTDVLTVLGASDFRPHLGGTQSAPQGLGTVSFAATATDVTATLDGATMKLADHVASVLLVDAATGDPVTLSYGIITKRTAGATGQLTSVSVPLGDATVPKDLRAYLMIDTYPAAMANVTIP